MQSTRRLFMLFLLFLLFLLFIGSPTITAADGLSDAQRGQEAAQRGNLDTAIRLYTSAIMSGELESWNLAIAYSNRGNTWGKIGS